MKASLLDATLKMATQDWTPIVLRKDEKRVHRQNPPGTKAFKQLDSDDPLPPQKMSVADRNSIVNKRMAKKWTRAMLAQHAGVTENDVRDVEQLTHQPSATVLAKIKKALK